MTVPYAKNCRIAGFSLNTADAEGLAQFYERAFGCRRVAATRLSADECRNTLGIQAGAFRITLHLGSEIIDLIQCDAPGRPYPSSATSADLIFQHFAIVVADIAQAYRRLSAIKGWQPISTDGPERLPAASGGVTAFKFRDPEGHPLELLAFPTGQVPAVWRMHDAETICLGIDHTAISVADTIRSARFYERLGFKVSSRSFNEGPEQQRLDGLAETGLDVMGLSTIDAKPHLELLRYAGARASADLPPRPHDIAATRFVLQVCDRAGAGSDTGATRLISDPDGHRLTIRSWREG
jgi:catechol 2,3-dioxygenase-like lactoylglutathione lyase family enzyme